VRGSREGARPESTTASAIAATSGSAKPTAKKTVTIKRTQDECTFELEAPEDLKETAKDDMGFTLSSDSFQFVGFAGQALYPEPKHVLDMFQDKGEHEVLYAGKDTGVPLKILKAKTLSSGASPSSQISGMGGELYTGDRPTGCSFNCSGTAARQAEAVAMCKSVKISVAKGDKPKE
jgi:hypothetical protein